MQSRQECAEDSAGDTINASFKLRLKPRITSALQNTLKQLPNVEGSSATFDVKEGVVELHKDFCGKTKIFFHSAKKEFSYAVTLNVDSSSISDLSGLIPPALNIKNISIPKKREWNSILSQLTPDNSEKYQNRVRSFEQISTR